MRIATIGCIFIASLGLALAAPQAALGANSLETTGAIEAVTVYRGQALVTRLVDIPGPAGLHELVVTDLPEQVLPGSLYAESADGVEVRSVLYRQRPVTQDVREEVRTLDTNIREMTDKIAANAQSTALLAERKALLDKLEAFTAPTVNVELTKGVLNPGTLKEMAGYLIDQRKSLSEDDLKLKLEKRDLDEQLGVLKRQRDELAGASARTAREALVFLNLEKPKGQLRLRYIVNQASWSPSYTVRAGEDRAAVSVEYYASIQQMSGEDWKDVAMTLSTATPSLVAKAPSLEPLHLQLAAIQAQQAAVMGQTEYDQARKDLEKSKISLNNSRAGNMPAPNGGDAGPGGGGGQVFRAQAFDAPLNEVACQEQVMEWANPGDFKKAAENPNRNPASDTESLSVTYQLASRTSLPSRSDRQLIQIASLPMSGEFYKLAVPLLTDSVYEEAIVTNSANTVLLAGPVSTYLAGEFVGHGEIPNVTVGEKFKLGFGIDSSLRVARELQEKTESLQGGNRIVDLSYRLTIENFGSKASTVRLLDRKPVSNGSDVKSTLVSATPKISDDAAYLQTDSKKGILRWDVQVAPQAIATNAVAVEYQLRLEYDKQMSISGMALLSN